MSSRVQMAVEMVAFPSWISTWALPSHTSVPWESPAIRIRSEKYFGLVSISICMAKSVPNSGIPRHPSLHPPMDSGSILSAFVLANRDMTSFWSSGTSLALMPVRSSNIRIIVGSSCPSISSFSRFPSMEW